MVSIEAMMLGRLRPVGDRIVPGGRTTTVQFPQFSARRTVFFDSGTSALAAAVAAARANRQVQTPEVLIPAYGCPAMVSAAVWAGVRPVLVDLEHDRHGYDLDAVADALSDSTVAIIAWSFLGIPERLSALRALTADRQITLIEDSAQRLPFDSPAIHGDLVVLSFGRGKPVSVLEGGALLAMRDDLADVIESPAPSDGGIRGPLERRIFNLLTSRLGYAVLESLPGLGIGETRYTPLDAVRGMTPSAMAALAANLERAPHRNTSVRTLYSRELRALDGLIDLAAVAGVDDSEWLLRFPLLARDETQRDALFDALNARGLGPSRMYRHALRRIPGVLADVEVRGTLDRADDFAARVLTLPTHDGVTERDAQAIRDVLVEVVAG